MTTRIRTAPALAVLLVGAALSTAGAADAVAHAGPGPVGWASVGGGRR